MAIQPAKKLTAIPEFPSLARRATGEYNGMAYSFGTHMGGPGPFVPEINALAENVQHNAQEAADAAGGSSDAQEAAEAARDAAADSAGAADGFSRNAAASANASAESAGSAADSDIAAAAQARLADDARVAAQGARDTTAGLLSDTLDARNDALAYRDQAEVFASSQLKGSSSTSIVPGAGAKALAMEPSRSFVPGMYVIASSVSDLGIWMSGRVQSYDMGTGDLVIGVDAYAGAAAKADWVIGVAVPGEHNGMTRQRIAASAVAVPGVVYVIVGADLTLTLPPAASWQDGDPFGVRLGVAVSNRQQIDFGDLTVRGQPGGLRYINRRGFALDLVYDSSSGGFV